MDGPSATAAGPQRRHPAGERSGHRGAPRVPPIHKHRGEPLHVCYAILPPFSSFSVVHRKMCVFRVQERTALSLDLKLLESRGFIFSSDWAPRGQGRVPLRRAP